MLHFGKGVRFQECFNSLYERLIPKNKLSVSHFEHASHRNKNYRYKIPIALTVHIRAYIQPPSAKVTIQLLFCFYKPDSESLLKKKPKKQTKHTTKQPRQ